MIHLVPGRPATQNGMKDTYGRVLCELAAADERVVYLDADLASPSGALSTFGRQFPERFFDCGIMEANMVGTANGMSAAGLIPFAHTFACFIARKCADSIFLTGCFANQNTKLLGSDPGVTAEQNGASHAGMEDMGILKNIPNITLLDPCDPVSLEAALRLCKDHHGMCYIRYNRKAARCIYESGSAFSLTEGRLLREGKDVSIIASGIMTAEALDAADMLAAKGIEAAVADILVWKPIDEALLVRCAGTTGAIVTAENHNTRTGLGATVAETLARTHPVPMEMVGVDDQFGQVGMLDFQKKAYHMRAVDIAEKALAAIARKRG